MAALCKNPPKKLKRSHYQNEIENECMHKNTALLEFSASYFFVLLERKFKRTTWRHAENYRVF